MVKESLRRIFALAMPAAPAPAIQAAPPRPRMIEIATRSPIGSMGTDTYGGYSLEEYLHELRGYQRAIQFDKMRRSDSQVRMLLSAVKNPIKSANWEIEAADDSLEAQSDAELIRHILFNDCKKPFKKTLAEALTFLEFGHCLLEKTFKLVLNHPTFGTYHGIQGLDWISPKTIERWNIDPKTGALVTVTQMASGDLQRHVDIPSPFLLRFGLDVEGANYEGISWLRPIYGNWIRKGVYMKLNAIGIEKHAVPTPVAKTDMDPTSVQYRNLQTAMELLSSGEANYMIVPRELELDFNPNSYDPEKVEASIDAEDRRMAKAFLAMFTELGSGGNGGAFALSNDQSDFFLGGIESVADEVADPFNQDLIPELVRMNRGPRAAYPKLKHSGISDKAGKELSDILSALGGQKYIKPDDLLEEHLRKRLGLPKMSLIGQRDASPPPSFGFSEGKLAERIRKRIYG